MRLGFVGVGRWGSKLAEAFRACGAEIVAFDRGSFAYPRCSSQHNLGSCKACAERWLDGFGSYQPWRSQLADKSIDAIVAVAPPEVTTEVALTCAAAGKPVMATKPLFDHPETIWAPFYVDFWRLYSDLHWEWSLHREKYTTAMIQLEGSGPFRSFPGALDYGPHVVAQLFDAWRCYEPVLVKAARRTAEVTPEGEVFWAEYRLGVPDGEHKAYLEFGNGSSFPRRNIHLSYGSRGECLTAFEEGTRIGTEEKSTVLQRFCQSFLNDIHEGFVDTRLLELSRRGMAELRKIREMATRGD